MNWTGLKGLISGHNNGDCNVSMEQLQSRLRQAVNDKRYLLVLDDVWHEDKEIWDDLRNLLCGGKPRSKIIVTSRSRVVAHIMGAREPYELEGLPRNNLGSCLES